MNGLVFPENRPLDFVCLGRANVDLYAMERGASLFETTGFIKNVGGSPANIATALSRLGCKAGLISKVSDDQLGHFVLDFLTRNGVDVSQVQIDQSGETRTSLAFAEVKPENCDVLFYRKNASDLFLSEEEIDEDYIKSARAILITGTAFSASPSREAMFIAMSLAQKHGTLIILDLDHRVSAWNKLDEASKYYSRAARQCDIVIGNTEEIHLLAFESDVSSDVERAQFLLKHQPKIVVIKKGKAGCDAYTLADQLHIDAMPVKVLKPYGAGDAFAGAFLNGLLKNKSLKECLALGSAAGAIVVAKESCTEAMPTMDEIKAFRSLN